jgi:hypothetical protein
MNVKLIEEEKITAVQDGRVETEYSVVGCGSDRCMVNQALLAN